MIGAHPLRNAAVAAAVLVALSGGAFAVQKMSYSRPPIVLSAPVAAPPAVAEPALAGPVAPAPSAAPAASTVPAIDPAWLTDNARLSGVPEVALQAYARAQLTAPPSCHLGWTTLAGIGWVESQHGTLDGRTLGADGFSSTRILGPALDGTHQTKAIPATRASTRMHGDAAWDHAVGPLQFIPSTWAVWKADGDADGVSNPNDINDAALAAAHYLCADAHDLSTADGWSAAVLSYNNSGDYLQAVNAAATTYAQRTS